ncbi:hypothetical protein ACQPZK_23690 [Micromonospora sp. CA-249363]|uniref:hypothetical protein n=1 Tax=Micromonospora sp. CA-249363 TaxID=3239963 RepID=UPI003D8AC9F0
MTDEMVSGLVAKIVTDDELVINIGSAQGVKEGMLFDVFDSRTQDIRDPKTGKVLGSVDRYQARIRITQVGEHVALARHVLPVRNRSLSAVAEVLSGSPSRSSLSSDMWPEGVTAHDPVRFTGDYYSRE